MADPTTIPAIALVLRLVVAFVVEVEVEVEVEVGVGAEAVLEVEVIAIVEVKLFELPAVVDAERLLGPDSDAVVDDRVDEVVVEGAELLEEEVPSPRSTTNPGEGIFGSPT